MHQDAGNVLRRGQEVTWDVRLVDGVAEGWSLEVLVDTDVEVVSFATPTREVALAKTPELLVCWDGLSPAGSRFKIKAALEADFFNPVLATPVAGIVRSIYLAAPPLLEGDCTGDRFHSSETRKLTALNEAPASLPALRTGVNSGVLVELELLHQPPLLL
jgi:hypothetical protein